LKARRGCERFRFNGHVVSLLAEPDPADARRIRISVESDGGFSLKVLRGDEARVFAIDAGRRTLIF
jgi:hypothetical protein